MSAFSLGLQQTNPSMLPAIGWRCCSFYVFFVAGGVLLLPARLFYSLLSFFRPTSFICCVGLHHHTTIAFYSARRIVLRAFWFPSIFSLLFFALSLTLYSTCLCLACAAPVHTTHHTHTHRCSAFTPSHSPGRGRQKSSWPCGCSAGRQRLPFTALAGGRGKKGRAGVGKNRLSRAITTQLQSAHTQRTRAKAKHFLWGFPAGVCAVWVRV